MADTGVGEREDPLADLSSLLLLPRTLAASGVSSSESTEKILTALLESMELRHSPIPAQLKETTCPSLPLGKDNQVPLSNGRPEFDGRRPGIGRKRAQFSFKPTARQPVPTVDFSSLDEIDDPEEYFARFELLTRADKELKRLRGELSTEPSNDHVFSEKSRRRPGISRRKSCYNYSLPVNTGLSETLETSGLIEDDSLVHREEIDVSSAKKIESMSARRAELSRLENKDSVVNANKNVEGILDDLLSSFHELEEGEEVTFLQETLQLKSINAEKLHLPNVIASASNNFASSATKRIRLSTERKVVGKSRSSSRSPLAALSTLQQRITFRNQLSDEYTEHPDDDASDFSSPSTSGRKQTVSPSSHDRPNVDASAFSSPRTVQNKQSASPSTHDLANVDASAILSPHASKTKLNVSPSSHDHPDVDAAAFSSSLTSQTRQCTSASTHDNPHIDASAVFSPRAGQSKQFVSPSSHDHPDVEAAAFSSPLTGQSKQSASHTSHNRDVPVCGEDPANETLCSSGRKSLEHQDAPASDRPNVDVCSPFTNGQKSSSLQDNSIFSASRDDGVHGNCDNFSPSDVAADDTVGQGTARDALSKCGESENKSSAFVGNTEGETCQTSAAFSPPERKNRKVHKAINETCQTSTTVSSPKGKKQKERKGRNDYSVTKRKSLAGAGLKWDSGIRRSTRIKSRPLKHWLGERFLYGRIHDSLCTVIGVKEYSPANDGKKSKMKVKSFVPQEFADLVEQAGRF